MGDVVNLRRARKQRDRRAKDDAAQAKRAAHGRPQAERELTAAQTRLEAAKLDAHRRARETEDQA
jgi:capsule polysaccharide export protein KpsE/RkpR